ncbi:kank2, partial [Symbiodinium necroappetens]
VDQVTKQGKTALLLAAQFGRQEICKFLISKGAKVEHQDEDGQTALFCAVQAGNHELVTSLIELKCPI